MNITLGLAMLVSAAFGSSVANIATTTSVAIVRSAQSVQQYTRTYFKDIPVMAEIASCESHFRQFDADGNVLRGKVNTDDRGLMQINLKYHADTAEKLGLDLNSIEGNAAYARQLYEREGTDPWISSSKCWGKNKNSPMPESVATEKTIKSNSPTLAVNQ